MAEKVQKFRDYPLNLAELEAHLIRLYGGPVIGGRDLTAALGFRSNIAFQRAVNRGVIPLPFFRMEGRRGVFLLVTDLARYLLERRTLAEQALDHEKNSSEVARREK